MVQVGDHLRVKWREKEQGAGQDGQSATIWVKNGGENICSPVSAGQSSERGQWKLIALAASTQQEREAGRGRGDRESRRFSIVFTFVPF